MADVQAAPEGLALQRRWDGWLLPGLRPDKIGALADAERPVVGRLHGAGRARFRAQIADDAASIIDRERAIARFDGVRRAYVCAFLAALAAGVGMIAGHAEHALLSVVTAFSRPVGRRLPAR